MTLEFSVAALTISDGTTVELPTTGVVVFVGPNNAGKSVALSEIYAQLGNPINPQARPKVIREIGTRKAGTPEDLEQWLETHAVRREPTLSEPYVIYRRHSARQSLTNLVSGWQSGGPYVTNLVEYLAFFLGGSNRLDLVGSVNMWDTMNDEPQSPLQMLFANPRLEGELARAVREAFGTPAFVNRHGGLHIHLQLGDIEAPLDDPPSREYMDRLRGTPYVKDQGDGIRSFVGIMLSVLAARYPIVVIDEPEAFLHPPQARLLGRKLATMVPQGTQVFTATHSTSVLLGLLEGPAENVTVIRLTRDGEINPTAVLDHQSVSRLWGDPLLRYSNVLDGLFHRGVVLCEGDADSAFYATALDWSREQSGQPASDLLFTQCGGKARMHVAIRALRSVDVPVRAVADFDVLRDAAELRRIVEALGGTWDECSELQRMIAADIGARGRNPTKRYVHEELNRILEPLDPEQPLTSQAVENIRAAARVETGWEQAKQSGLRSLSGDTYTRAQRLLTCLAGFGLFVVPVGELERFCPEAGGLHGPAWVARALQLEAHKDDEARKLLDAVSASFA